MSSLQLVVAKALVQHEHEQGLVERWDDIGPQVRKNYMGLAKAALEAICAARSRKGKR